MSVHLDDSLDWSEFFARGIGPRQVRIGSGVRSQLAAVVSELGPQRVALLSDATPIRCPDGDLKAWAEEALAGLGVDLIRVVLPSGTTADEAAVQAATDGCRAADVVVTVGSGTISDLGKVASLGRPHVIVQTAASVNGYADDESVLLRNGVKRTTHSAYPDTLLVDTDVIALAPADLNRSGLGDMISMFTAPADWYLAHQLGMDPHWDGEAALLAREHGDRMLTAAAGIGTGAAADLELLANLLTLSGISMGLAGQTSPSSGTEHTVSHMIDMWAGARHLTHNLHGAQVGVTTLWASLLWRRVVERLDSGSFPAVRPLSTDAAEQLVRSVFLEMDPTGRSGEECWSDYRKKLTRMQDPQFAERVHSFVSAWPMHREFLTAQCLADPAAIAAALREAGAPATADRVNGGDPELSTWAFANNHLMRNRFNVCDLAFAAGLWSQDLARELIEEADQLVGTESR
jgi:Glycerol dehydrogenase and related enzymes